MKVLGDGPLGKSISDYNEIIKARAKRTGALTGKEGIPISAGEVGLKPMPALEGVKRGGDKKADTSAIDVGVAITEKPITRRLDAIKAAEELAGVV